MLVLSVAFALLLGISIAARRYRGVSEVLDGYAAEAFCNNEFGTNLATITSAQENADAIAACLSVDPNGECYIGLRRDSEFQSWYFTEENHPYAANAPAYMNWNQLCAVFSPLQTGRWDEEYCDVETTKHAFVCNADINNPQAFCVVDFTDWFRGDSFDESTGTFANKVANGVDAKFEGGTFAQETGVDGLNGFPTVYAATDAKIYWGPSIGVGDYTVFHVARYSGTSGGRLFDSETGAWLSGFHADKAGVAYHNAWITPIVDHFKEGTGWPYIISSDSWDVYRANGKPYQDLKGNRIDSKRITSNLREGSNFDFAELIFVDGVALDETKMACIEFYLSSRYGIAVESTYSHQYAANAIPSIQFWDNFDYSGKGGESDSSEYNVYFYVIAALVVVNLLCIARYCMYSRHGAKKGYKTVRMQSETDADV
jgi:hypothetical protein